MGSLIAGSQKGRRHTAVVPWGQGDDPSPWFSGRSLSET